MKGRIRSKAMQDESDPPAAISNPVSAESYCKDAKVHSEEMKSCNPRDTIASSEICCDPSIRSAAGSPLILNAPAFIKSERQTFEKTIPQRTRINAD